MKSLKLFTLLFIVLSSPTLFALTCDQYYQQYSFNVVELHDTFANCRYVYHDGDVVSYKNYIINGTYSPANNGQWTWLEEQKWVCVGNYADCVFKQV